MNILLLILALTSPANLETKINNFTLRETVTIVKNMTYIGWILESEALVARWTLKIQCRRGLAEPIDFDRYYLAEQRVVDLQHTRQDLVWRYNVVVKCMECRGILLPDGTPRRIRLESTGWACLFQYI